MDFYIKWQLVDPARLFTATGGDEEAAAARLADIVQDRIKSVVAQPPLQQIVADAQRPPATLFVPDELHSAAGTGRRTGRRALQRIDLPDDVAHASTRA